MNITFRQLRVFTEVVRQGSVQRAAEALHLSAPAVSMQIREIESQVGLVLFDRPGRRRVLSTECEYFLVYSRRLQATLKEAEAFRYFLLRRARPISPECSGSRRQWPECADELAAPGQARPRHGKGANR